MDGGGVVGGVVAALVGLGLTRLGWLAWAGRELRWVGRALGDPQERRSLLLGGLTLYQTYLGSSVALVVAGPATAVLGIGLAARSAGGGATDPWWWWAASLLGTAAWGVAFLYVTAYFWTGVPDALRPVAQRGQPSPGGVDDEGRPHPLDRLLRTPGAVDLGPDPARPPWARLDPEWTGYRPRPFGLGEPEPW